MEATNIENKPIESKIGINTKKASFTYEDKTYFVKIRAHSHINDTSRIVSWDTIQYESTRKAIIQEVALAFLKNVPYSQDFNRASIKFEGRSHGKIEYFKNDAQVDSATLETKRCIALTSLSRRHLKIDIQPARPLVRGIKRPVGHNTCYANSLVQLMANTYGEILRKPLSRAPSKNDIHHHQREALRVKLADLLEEVQSDRADTTELVSETKVTALMKCMHALYSDARWNDATQQHDVLELFSQIRYALELPNIGEMLLGVDSNSAVHPYVSITPPAKELPGTKISTLLASSPFSIAAKTQRTRADAPYLLPVHINRHTGKEKSQTPLEIDDKLTFTTTDGTVEYVLDSCIVHKGDKSTGHYFTYRLINGMLCECNDDKVREVDNEEFQSIAAQDGYLLLYKKWIPSSVQEVD